ncbi:hypothetical protein [Curtobacterium sp. 9128]|uniref:hypothetical protein n=1 Tax=Curtobacterium sp. 9128 TaxID=1793722 RepID=UPI0011A3349A|nr:hypothetical protein [Curtobacterium sp. 9128]
MDWWNDLRDWTSSDTGWRVISGALIPFVAIVVAGVIAALIGRGATKRVVSLHEREAKNAAVAGIISAARKAATWGTLGHDERGYADHLAEDADIRLRLLPVSGASLAANWTQHEIADIKKNSSTFSFQADQSLAEFRDRLLEWQSRPGKARKLFKYDLERWKFESPDPDADLIKRQQDWSADQASGKRTPDAAPAPTPTTTSLRPAPATSSAPAAGSAAVPAATRGSDPQATTPISGGSNAPTRSFGDGLTRPYGDDQPAPVRPTLGTPGVAAGSTTEAGGPSATSPADTDQDNADVIDEQAPAADRPQSPSSAPRGPDEDRGGRPAVSVDAAGTTSTTSIPTRIADAPAEPADANETSEAPYTQPISANELRRRAEDDE